MFTQPDEMEREDIARIFRDVLTTQGLDAALVRLDRTDSGWHIEATDRGDRLISVDVPTGPASAVRAALTRWTASQD